LAAEKIRIVRAERAAGWSLFSYGSMTCEGADPAYLLALASHLGLPAGRPGAAVALAATPAMTAARPPSAGAAQAPGSLVDVRLVRALQAAGFNPGTFGDQACQVTLARNGWTYRLKVTLDAGGHELSMITRLGEPVLPRDLPGRAVAQLLAGSRSIRPARFLLATTGADGRQQLYLRATTHTLTLEPAELREQIDRFCAAISGSYSLWKPWQAASGGTARR
jgi:hypothetical protein